MKQRQTYAFTELAIVSRLSTALMLSTITRLEVFSCLLCQAKVTFSTVGASLESVICYRPMNGKAFLVINWSENTISISEFSLN